MSKAVFPGTFDPATNGHLNIIERSSKIFDEVDVVVARNVQKKCMFSAEERKSLLDELTGEFPNVSVHISDGLVVDYAKRNGASVLLRGVRNSIDFSYEFDLSLFNRGLCAEIETLFIPTSQDFLTVKSSAVKEFAAFGGDISGMVPKIVAEAVMRKIASGNY